MVHPGGPGLAAVCARLAEPPLSLGVTAASSATEAIARLGSDPFAAVLVLDQPNVLDGPGLLATAALVAPDTLRVLLVDGAGDLALEQPIAGDTSPIVRFDLASGSLHNLTVLLCEGLKLIRLVGEQRELVSRLGIEYDKLQRREKLLDVVVKERTSALRDSYERLKQAHRQALFGLAEAIEAKDPYTNGHCSRVAGYSLVLAEESGHFDETELETLEFGAFLHDIGKIGIRDAVLLKPGPLDDDEWDHMRLHPQKGFEIASQIEALEPILSAVRNHHERWDGTGYPDRMVGDGIPMAARIVAIADAFDAMVTDRPYKDALPLPICDKLLRKNAGVMYDPDLVEVFCRHQIGAMFAAEESETRVLDPAETALLEAVDRS